MKRGRRLVVMIAGLMTMCSSSLPWIGGAMPLNTSFGHMLSSFLGTVSGGAVMINLAALNQIPMAAVLFVLGVASIISAVLGSKPIAILAAVLDIIITSMWFMSANLDLGNLFTDFMQLGLGTQLGIGSAALGILAVAMPKLLRPGGGA